MVEVIDYGGGNLGSLLRCLRRLDADYRVVERGDGLSGEPLVLPGVGAFAAVMRGLEERGFDTAIRAAAAHGTPFLGICVGLQVLFDGSEENPGVPGLGLLPGTVVRFRQGKVPQIGWNRITARPGSGWKDGHVYFVNSYHPLPARAAVNLYTADYGGEFCAAAQQDNLTAFQFHPERSGAFGHTILRRWLDAL